MTRLPPILNSVSMSEGRADLQNAAPVGAESPVGPFNVRAAAGNAYLWFILASDKRDLLAVRVGHGAGALSSLQVSHEDDGFQLNVVTALGPMRVRLRISANKGATLHWTVSLLPRVDTAITTWPRDLWLLGAVPATIHTAQRGLRTGTLFASAEEPSPLSFLYVQDFSSLSEYFNTTHRTPANTVGGSWPELGYEPPTGADCILPKAREITMSDAYLHLSDEVPETPEAAASLYLDLLAEYYLSRPQEPVTYRDWPDRAARALRDLSLSPACTYERQGAVFLKPYAGDGTKPPESMVQFTLALNIAEYERWRGAPSSLGAALRRTPALFFNDDLKTIVRWLPGEAFDSAQAEDNMNHRAMDSWYLHHALFNLYRLHHEGDRLAGELFGKSLPYLIRVAHRFDYHWPIFFDLKSLDIIRAEAAPGRGGETDVAGLYALVMVHAYELFDDVAYLNEAKAAMRRLCGLGFDVAYQLNTTGFAAEAALRLWKISREPQFLQLSEVCMANLFDNMWLWQCGYGYAAAAYRPFFGMFPLRDAPYLAPYEELEGHAKFHEFATLAGDALRPSLRLLLAEYIKFALDRGWSYYPDALPDDMLSDKARNGVVNRALSIPIEDLHDGFEQSGEVGQEVYGAGIAFVFTSRHYMHLPDSQLIAYANYPMYDFHLKATRSASWRAGGDPRAGGELRVVPANADTPPVAVCVFAVTGAARLPLEGQITPEGHALFPFQGGQTLEIMWAEPNQADERATVVGALVGR